MSMEWMKSFSTLAFALLLVMACAAAQPAVTIAPKNAANQTGELYLGEAVPYTVTVFNLGATALESLKLKLDVSEGLYLSENEAQMQSIVREVDELQPGSLKEFEVTVGNSRLAEQALLSVSYGIEKYTHSVTTFASVVERPLQIDALLSESIPAAKQSSLFFDLKNVGTEDIRMIRAELRLPSDIEAASEPVTLAKLAPGESLLNKELKFFPAAGAKGKKKIELAVSFEDSRGEHELLEAFTVDINQVDLISMLLFSALAAVLLYFIYAVFFKNMGKKKEENLPEEKPAAQNQ